jgi:FkbM family methyltransferase
MAASLLSKVSNTIRAEGWRGLERKGLEKIRHKVELWTFRPYRVKKKICGEVVDLLIGDPCAKAWYDQEHDWPELVWLKENMVDCHDIVVDCGAHQGLTTVLFSRWASDGNVFGYEAHPRNARIAQNNLVLNGAHNAVVKHRAVGASIGTVRISDHSNAALLGDIQAQGIDVPLVTLDSEFDSVTPTFIKIDVEGQELNVLRGAKRLLKSRPKLDIEIHCCIHNDATAEVAEILDVICVRDYNAFVQFEVDGPIEPYDLGTQAKDVISSHDIVHLFCLPR